MISLLTTSMTHISRLCCSLGYVGNVMIVNTLDALEKTPGTPCASLSPSHINNAGAVKVFYKSICAFASQK